MFCGWLKMLMERKQRKHWRNTMANHKCSECIWMHTLTDSSNRHISICLFDQSEYYLQEIGYCTEDCELEGYAEELWEEYNG